MRPSHTALLALLVVSTSGCIDRTRVNASCQWTGDTNFPIDLENAVHRQHLVDDAQLAEELAIRFADAEHKRLFGYEGHGGLIGRGRLRERCMATLVEAIERNHAVTAEQVLDARAQRDARFDAAVLLSFVVPYALGAAGVWRLVRRRFSSDTRSVRLAALIVTSCVVGAAALLMFPLWGAVWEFARVGNGHMSSFRAARAPWIRHVGELYAGGVVLFCAVAFMYDRMMPDPHVSSDVPSPDVIRLR